MKLGNDELEVACDALWFVKTRDLASAAQDELWDRLQALRSGDYGGDAQAKLSPVETAAVAQALRVCADATPLDDDEQRLLDRIAAL
jgi:hypothetical protein